MLARRESRVPAHVWQMESKHNVLARDTRSQQFVGHRTRRAVVLHPDLAVLDVNVNDAAVDAPDTVPADVHDLVVIVLAVHDCLGLDPAVRGRVPGVIFHHSSYYLALPL